MPPVLVGIGVALTGGVATGLTAGVIGTMAIAGVGASVYGTVAGAKATKAGIKAQESAFASQRQQVEEQLKNEQKVIAQNQALAEKQLILESQRQKIETLASLSYAKSQQPVVMSTPQPIRERTLSIVDRINLFIEGIL